MRADRAAVLADLATVLIAHAEAEESKVYPALQDVTAVTLKRSALRGTAHGNAARWLPYLLFGLLAGVYVDRHRRQPLLIGADFAQGGRSGRDPPGRRS